MLVLQTAALYKKHTFLAVIERRVAVELEHCCFTMGEIVYADMLCIRQVGYCHPLARALPSLSSSMWLIRRTIAVFSSLARSLALIASDTISCHSNTWLWVSSALPDSLACKQREEGESWKDEPVWAGLLRKKSPTWEAALLVNCSRSACRVLCCSSYTTSLASSMSSGRKTNSVQKERTHSCIKDLTYHRESDIDKWNSCSDIETLQPFTVLCFELVILFQLPKVFLPLLLQCCDLTPQRSQVRGGTSSLKGEMESSLKSLILRSSSLHLDVSYL